MTMGVTSRRDFYENLYKIFRGMVEGVFGGMEATYNNKTRCRLDTTRQTDVMLVAAFQNLKTQFKVLKTFEGGDLLDNSATTKRFKM
jgi:hypothetical protein